MLHGEVANHVFANPHCFFQHLNLLPIAVMAELNVDAFFVLSDRISESSLTSLLVVENLGTRFHDHVAVFGDVAFNFFLRDVRTKDVHGLVIRIERHGLCRRGDFRLTKVSDGSNTLSPCVHIDRSLVQLHAHGLAEPWQIGLTPPKAFDDREHQDGQDCNDNCAGEGSHKQSVSTNGP